MGGGGGGRIIKFPRSLVIVIDVGVVLLVFTIELFPLPVDPLELLIVGEAAVTDAVVVVVAVFKYEMRFV